MLGCTSASGNSIGLCLIWHRKVAALASTANTINDHEKELGLLADRFTLWSWQGIIQN